MGNFFNVKPKYKTIDKTNTKLNIFMYDPQYEIGKITNLERHREEESEEFEIYTHIYFGIKFYRLRNDLTIDRINQIKDLIKYKYDMSEHQNLIIYIENENNIHYRYNSFLLIKEISTLYPEMHPLFLFVHYSNVSKREYINYLKDLYTESKIYNKIDEYSFTVFQYEENNFKNKLFNEIWDAISYYNQIPYITFPILDQNTLGYTPELINLYTINLLLIGDSGAGKSTCINILKGKKIAYESPDSMNKTIQINEYLVEHLFTRGNRQIKLGLKLIDTLGFSQENIEKEKLLEYTKNIYYEGIKNKDKIHIILYLVDAGKVDRLLTKVQIDFLKSIMNEDKDIKILFIINKSKKPLSDDEGNIIESDAKRIFKRTIRRSFTDINFYNRLIENDESNIIELNFKYNTYTNTESFGVKNLIHKLYSIFSRFRVDIEQLNEIEDNNNELIFRTVNNSFFLNDIKTIKDAFIKAYNKAKILLTSALIMSSIISYTPVPFVDNIFIFALDISLIISIASLFGKKITTKDAKDILRTIINNQNRFFLIKTMGYSLKVIDLIGDGVKFIPIIGTIVGGIISNVSNSGEVYYVYKNTIDHYQKLTMEEQNIKQLLIKLGNFYNDNIDGLMEFYNNFDDEI